MSETHAHTACAQETGREGITLCALRDRSSYMCPLCGGIVPAARRAHHETWWCPCISQAEGPMQEQLLDNHSTPESKVDGELGHKGVLDGSSMEF